MKYYLKILHVSKFLINIIDCFEISYENVFLLNKKKKGILVQYSTYKMHGELYVRSCKIFIRGIVN